MTYVSVQAATFILLPPYSSSFSPPSSSSSSSSATSIYQMAVLHREDFEILRETDSVLLLGPNDVLLKKKKLKPPLLAPYVKGT